jgi:hypothetical protein
MTSVSDVRIIRLIEKLLAVQEGRGATEAEAAQAAEHVQRLLQEHNLTLAQVEASGGSTDEGARRSNEQTSLSASNAWKVTIMHAVAKGNFCLHRVRNVAQGKVRRKVHVLVGREVNVRVSKDLFVYLQRAAIRALAEAGLKQTVDYQAGQAFLEGCADRLAHRLHEARLQREKEDEERRVAQRAKGDASRALVLADVYGTEADANNDVLNDFPLGTTAVRRRGAEARRAERDARWEEYKAQGIEFYEAWYRAQGYDEAASKACARIARRSGRSRGGRGQRWTNADRRRGSAQYAQGQAAGSRISLSPQVGASDTPRLGGKR